MLDTEVQPPHMQNRLNYVRGLPVEKCHGFGDLIIGLFMLTDSCSKAEIGENITDMQ